MAGNYFAEKNHYRILVGFVVIWMGINFLQSAFTGLYPDEAYYWVYSKKMQWGYFDHPPMVALLVKLGELFDHNSLCTRLGTVLLSGGAVYFLFKALPGHIANVPVYIIAFLSVILFHVYGFVATPDAALFFFTALYFYAYRLYLQKQSLLHTLFLALGIVGLLYSKYHGILPVFFTFLSNPKLILKPSAWLVVLLVTILFLPHLYWQYINDWPTFRYHLSERVASRYRISKTTNYILGQLAVWGPLTAIPVFYRFFKMGKQELYIKAHQFTFWGVLLFFLLSSFNSSIEPHWTLVGGVSFIVLVLQVLNASGEGFKKLFIKLAAVNIFLVMVIRILLVVPHSPIARSNNLKPLFYGKSWADSIYKYAGNTPVVFIDSYGLPAMYQYYHPDVFTSGFNTINYRKNHYSISADEPNLHNKKVYLYTGTKMDTADIFVTNQYANTFLHVIDSFQAVNALKIKWRNLIKNIKAGETVNAAITIKNEKDFAVLTKNLALAYTFFKTRREKETSEKVLILKNGMQPGEVLNTNIELQLPRQPGKYRLVFSIVSPPFEGTLASNYFTVLVE